MAIRLRTIREKWSSQRVSLLMKTKVDISLYWLRDHGAREETCMSPFSCPCFPIILAGPSLTGSIGTTEYFVRIAHSLFALLAGWLSGQLSRRLCRCCRAQEP